MFSLEIGFCNNKGNQEPHTSVTWHMWEVSFINFHISIYSYMYSFLYSNIQNNILYFYLLK